ncbi:MAG: methyltransferase domain-containing protein [Porticoccaceae bacterium]|nr:methyltransferase domain-containing protein [Porticoccaceae bacterium]
MQEQQSLICEITDLSHDGRGVGRIAGKTCFVEGALPSETVELHINNSKRNYDEGRATKILSAANNRVEPGCKHFLRCGGCSLQHLDHDQQLQFKEQQLLNSLQRGGLEPATVLPALSAPQWGYRRRARLAVQRAKDGKFLVGFRNAGSRRIEPISQCPVLAAPLPEVIAQLPQWLVSVPHGIRIFEVELVSVDNSFAVAVEAGRLPNEAELGEILGSLNQMGHGPVQLWWKAGKQTRFTRLDKGTDALSFSVPGGLRLNFEPGQFIQVNGEINRLMIEQMLSLLPESGNLAVDLFCGTGNLSLPLTQRFTKVVGVEGLPELVKGAEDNARLNGLNNVEFAMADLTRAVGLSRINPSNEPIDLVLLDPPRNGAAGVISWVAKSKARQIVYISCHPSTMIRDAAVLAEAGYKMTAVGVMDMFPHTTHIEAMALFE